MGLDDESHRAELMSKEVDANNKQCQTAVDELKDIASDWPSDTVDSDKTRETCSELGESGTDFDESSEMDPTDPNATNLHVSLPWMSNGQDIIYSFLMPKRLLSLRQLCVLLEIEYRKGICCSKAITGTCKVDDREIKIHYSITTGENYKGHNDSQ